jgi:iron complex outermembrane receptor protein
VLDGRRLPGVPATWVDALLHAAPLAARGWWADAEVRHASGYLVDDALQTRTSPWTTLDLRVGWTGRAGGNDLRPFVGVANAFDRRYVGSVVINAARGRYYEPAPGRSLVAGVSMTLGS